MYSIQDHGTMMADRVRVSAYRCALQTVLKPGDVVVEIGTGAGLFAIFACELGARKVYAIECEESLELARQIARENGCLERIEFIRAVSTTVQLPEQANLVLADIHGGLPVFGRGIESLIDARRRFLVPGGTIIPARERIWAAAVALPESHYERVAIWSNRRWGVDLSAGQRFGVNSTFSARVCPQNFVTSCGCIAVLDYLSLESPSICGQVTLEAIRRAEANGYSLWFDAELAREVTLTSAPGEPETAYPNVFAPWSAPMTLQSADRVTAEFRFALVNDDYVWNWNTRIQSPLEEQKGEFRQSTLNSMFVTLEPLRKQAPGYRPLLNRRGALAAAILQMMNGGSSVQDIAVKAREQFPDLLTSEREAFRAVASLVHDYSA